METVAAETGGIKQSMGGHAKLRWKLEFGEAKTARIGG